MPEEIVDPFYKQYKNGGFIPVEIFINGIIALICYVGIGFNFCLVCVTIKTKSLHSSCKIMLAAYAFFSSFLLFGSAIKFFIFLFGVNYISLRSCLLLQFVPLTGSAIAVTLQLCIGIDRLFGVLFPIWYNSQGQHLIYKLAIAFCSIKTALFDCFTFLACSNHWEKQVMCNLGDPAHLPENRQYSDINTLIIYCGEFMCYAIISLIVWRKKSQISEHARKLTISLCVLMSIGLICFILNLIFFNAILPLFNLDAYTVEYFFYPMCLALQTTAYGSSAPVLYFCNDQYRCALRALFCGHPNASSNAAGVIVPTVHLCHRLQQSSQQQQHSQNIL